jgi:hypothetical protein
MPRFIHLAFRLPLRWLSSFTPATYLSKRRDSLPCCLMHPE